MENLTLPVQFAPLALGALQATECQWLMKPNPESCFPKLVHSLTSTKTYVSREI